MSSDAVGGAAASGAGGKTDRAYHYIRERIEDGRYSPGRRLVFDALAREIGVSTVPVREAVRLLEAEQVVTFERNVGAQVALMHEAEYEHTMQTLALVEGAATALAAPSIDADRIARARAINEEIRDLLSAGGGLDARRVTELNQSFHTVLFEGCPNPHLLDLVDRGWRRLSLLRESVFGFVPGRAQHSVEEHEELLVLLEAGAPALEIELCARRHRTNTLDAVLAYQKTHRRPGRRP